jgi:alpha-galactosidase
LPIRVRLNGKIHNIISRVYKLKGEDESYIISDDALKEAGIRLSSQFLGTGFSDKVRVLGDFGSRIYFVNKIQERD